MNLLLLMLWAIPLTIMQADPGSASAADSMPWPIQLGLNGVTLGALVAFFVWQNKQISGGKWYPETIVTRMLAEKDATIADKDRTIAGKDALIEEQRSTIKAAESTIDTTAKALVQATSNQAWVDELVRRVLGGSAESPRSGDNGGQGVAI